MEYDNTKLLQNKTNLKEKLYANWGYVWKMNKSKKSIKNSSSLYQTYRPTVIYKHKLKSGPPPMCIATLHPMAFNGMGLLPDAQNYGLHMHRECRERFPHHHGLTIPTCITHVPWCIPGSLTGGFLWSRWRGKRSRHCRCMLNPQFYVTGKRPIQWHFRDCNRGYHKGYHWCITDSFSLILSLGLFATFFYPVCHELYKYRRS